MPRLGTKRIHGRAALATGAGDGIGRATALCARSAARRSRSATSARTQAERTAGEARAMGVGATARRADVADAEQMVPFAAAVHDRYEAVDLLVNNAGSGLVAGFQETTHEDCKRLVDVNLVGVVHGCDAIDTAAANAGRRGRRPTTGGRWPVVIRDVQIAGIARARRAQPATRNTRHVTELGIELLDPWSA